MTMYYLIHSLNNYAQIGIIFHVRMRGSINLIASWDIDLNNYHEPCVFPPISTLSTIDLKSSLGLGPHQGVSPYDNDSNTT